MIDDNLTPLSDGERERLRRARIDLDPPRALEERTIEALRGRGLVRGSRRPFYTAAGIAAAAVIVIAAASSMLMHRAPASPVAAAPRFMLLLYAGTDPVTGTSDDRRQEYADWARDLGSRGVSITGEELTDDIRVLGGGGESGAALPPRGFFIVSAPDLSSAEQLASTCPHLRHGGRILIKRIAG